MDVPEPVTNAGADGGIGKATPMPDPRPAITIATESPVLEHSPATTGKTTITTINSVAQKHDGSKPGRKPTSKLKKDTNGERSTSLTTERPIGAKSNEDRHQPSSTSTTETKMDSEGVETNGRKSRPKSNERRNGKAGKKHGRSDETTKVEEPDVKLAPRERNAVNPIAERPRDVQPTTEPRRVIPTTEEPRNEIPIMGRPRGDIPIMVYRGRGKRPESAKLTTTFPPDQQRPETTPALVATPTNTPSTASTATAPPTEPEIGPSTPPSSPVPHRVTTSAGPPCLDKTRVCSYLQPERCVFKLYKNICCETCYYYGGY